MNPLDPPPVRDPITSVNVLKVSGPAEVGPISASWTKWFSDLFGVVNEVHAAGTTAERPSPVPYVGFMYFDTDLEMPIWALNATDWVDSSGVPV